MVKPNWQVGGLVCALTAALSVVFGGTSAVGAVAATGGFDPVQVLTLGNEYVVLGVTREGAEAGRFALETTGGDPQRASDDGVPLIYGRPRPWTSYTTVRLDGRNYVFGGKSETRAGRGAGYGKVVEPPALKDGAIDTAVAFLDGVLEVRQVLELARSSTSGLVDTVRIVYEVTNRGAVAHRVGLRIMLDTMLGGNDGAPLRMGEQSLTGDALAEGRGLPSFWQAFDALAEPRVVAQGTVADATTVRPDRMVATNWGNLADNAWEAPITPGREFVREGEEDLDSAVALYWDEEPLGPGESRLYATAYGLGGVTIIPGEVTLGLTAPASVTEEADGASSFPVVAYVQNVGKWPAREVKVALRLPEGLRVEEGERAERSVGDLAPGGEAAVAWRVRGKNLAGTAQRFQVEVSGAGLTGVVGERAVQFQGPPQLKVVGSPLPVVRVVGDGFAPERVTVEAAVSNAGQATARLVRATVSPSDGWRLAKYDKREKFLGNLEPGESRTVRWVVEPARPTGGDWPISVLATAGNGRPGAAELHSEVPGLKARLYPSAEATDTLKPGRLFRVDVRVANVSGLKGAEFEVTYDARRLAVVGVSRGTAFVGAGGELRPFTVEAIDNARGFVGRVRGECDGGAGLGAAVLLTMHFLAKEPGEAEVAVRNATLYSAEQQQEVELEPLQLRIEVPR